MQCSTPCLETGAKLKTQPWDGKGSLVEFILEKNLHRRDISSSQRAMVALEAERELAEEAKERLKLSPGRPKKPTEMFPGVFDESPSPTHTTSTSHPAKATANTAHTKPPADKKKSSGEAREQAAKLAGTNSSYVSKAKLVEAERPDLAEQVRLGTMSLEKAIKQIKAEKKTAARAAEVAAMQLEVKGNYAPDIIHGDALEAERELAEEAKKRLRQTARDTNQKLGRGQTGVETFPHPSRDDPEPYRPATPTTHTARAGQTKKPKRTETDERASKSREQAAKLAGTNSS